MAFAVKDRTKESSSTTGTGAITLSGAPSNYQTFNTAVGVGNNCWYCINNLGANEWEVGYGTLTASTTLARTQVIAGTNGTSAVNFSAGTKEVFVTLPAAFNNQTLGRTNMVINPHGSIQQETTAPVTVSAGVYFADQWLAAKVSSTGVLQASVASSTVSAYDPGVMIIKTTTAQGSLAAGDNAVILQYLEGTYIRRLLYGGSLARGSWLRFRANVSGIASATCSVALRNQANNRSWVQSFAVTTTPTDFFFFVPGDTTGTWTTDNSIGASLVFSHSCGTTSQTSTLGAWQAGNFVAANTQTNLMATLNAQLNITDVQWSASDVLLPFEPIDYQQELARCQRYFLAIGQLFPNGYGGTGAAVFNHTLLPVVMRVNPTVTLSQIANSNASSVATDSSGPTFVRVQASVTSGPGNAWSAASANLNARM